MLFCQGVNIGVSSLGSSQNRSRHWAMGVYHNSELIQKLPHLHLIIAVGINLALTRFICL